MSLNELRKISQQELALKTKLSTQTIRNWENGTPISNTDEISILSSLLTYSQSESVVQDMCLIGLKLSELKQSGEWKNIINQKTHSFFGVESFESYCKYKFGFSKTHISNLLRISQFVVLKEQNVEFIDAIYKKYKVSQLVELSSVNPKYRKYFTPQMTVQEIRKAKKYIKSNAFFIDKEDPCFNFIEYVKKWYISI